MKCTHCPLYSTWNGENGRDESCGLFGDGWDNKLQYENKEGEIEGCYVDRHYIGKVDKRYTEHLEQEAEYYEDMIHDNEFITKRFNEVK